MFTSISPNRDSSIDIAKGIGIILVVWGHQFSNCPVYDWIYLFHMPLFFMLSGCFIKDEPFFLFLYKKIRSLIVPFLFFYSSSLLLKVFIYYKRNGNCSHIYDTSFYALGNIDGPIWFLLSLFGALVIYYFVRKMSHPWVGAVVTFVLSLVLFYYHIDLPPYQTQGLMAVSFLYIGDIYNKIERKDNVLLFVAFICAPFFFYAGFNDIHLDMFFFEIPSNPIFIIAPAAFGSALTLLVSRHVNIRFIFRMLSICGKYSILILGLHTNTKVLDSLYRIILPIPVLQTLGEKYVEGVLKTILCVVFSLIIGYFINRFVPYLIKCSKDDRFLNYIKRSSKNIIKLHDLR